MAKRCVLFAQLVLDYFDNHEIPPEHLGEWLYHRKEGGEYATIFSGGPAMFEMVLEMVFKCRHQIKDKCTEFSWDPVAFFFEYQLNQPANSAKDLMAILSYAIPKSGFPWERAQGDERVTAFIPAELSLTGKPIPREPRKVLPRPTHPGSPTLQ